MINNSRSSWWLGTVVKRFEVFLFCVELGGRNCRSGGEC